MVDQKPKHSIMDLLPATTPDYAAPMWLGALQFSLGHSHTLDLYRAATGDKWEPSAVPINQMIDDSTDRKWHFVQSFTLWFNANIWGEF